MSFCLRCIQLLFTLGCMDFEWCWWYLAHIYEYFAHASLSLPLLLWELILYIHSLFDIGQDAGEVWADHEEGHVTQNGATYEGPLAATYRCRRYFWRYLSCLAADQRTFKSRIFLCAHAPWFAAQNLCQAISISITQIQRSTVTRVISSSSSGWLRWSKVWPPFWISRHSSLDPNDRHVARVRNVVRSCFFYFRLWLRVQFVCSLLTSDFRCI